MYVQWYSVQCFFSILDHLYFLRMQALSTSLLTSYQALPVPGLIAHGTPSLVGLRCIDIINTTCRKHMSRRHIIYIGKRDDNAHSGLGFVVVCLGKLCKVIFVDSVFCICMHYFSSDITQSVIIMKYYWQLFVTPQQYSYIHTCYNACTCELKSGQERIILTKNKLNKQNLSYDKTHIT